MPTHINSIRDLSHAVRGQRQRLGLSQETVAQRAHVSRQWLSEFESGKPTAELQLVVRLLEALGMRLSVGMVDESAQPPGGSLPEPVDLDLLLDQHRGP
jgi:HTH-type transcriptional regulator/antitoxin HipB